MATPLAPKLKVPELPLDVLFHHSPDMLLLFTVINEADLKILRYLQV